MATKSPPRSKEDVERNWEDLALEGDVNVDLKGRPSNMSKTGAWKAAPFIYGLAGGDTMSLFGIVGNLVFFLVGTLHFEVAEAATMLTNFVGTSFLVTVFWAFLADAYWGKFWTICVSALIEILGGVIMVVTVAQTHLLRPKCIAAPGAAPNSLAPCRKAGSDFMTPFNAGLYLLAIGSGGVKSCIAAFGADQFDESRAAEKLHEPRFFNFLYLSLQLGSLLAVTLITYLLTSVSATAGFSLVATAITLGLLLFWCGMPFFRHKLPSGSPFTRLAQVLVATFRNRKLSLPSSPDQLYEITSSKGSAIRGSRKLKHSKSLRIFDKAAILENGQAIDDPWRLCTVTQVEEFKRVMLMIPIWLTGCIVYTLFAQFTSFTIQQAASMDRHIGKLNLPASSVGAFSLLAIIIFVPIYDGVFVPLARKITKLPQGITTLQRIGVGLFFATFAMITAALVEHKRVNTAAAAVSELIRTTHRPPGPGFVIPLSAYWLLPQYFLIALTELMTTVGQLEFFYSEAPDGMRSIAICFFFTSFAIGNFLSTALVNITNHATREGSRGSWLKSPFLNQGGLTRFYYLLAILVAINLVFYLLFSYLYKYKPQNEIVDEDTVQGEENLPSKADTTD